MYVSSPLSQASNSSRSKTVSRRTMTKGTSLFRWQKQRVSAQTFSWRGSPLAQRQLLESPPSKIGNEGTPSRPQRLKLLARGT
ncbi:hypothetical protein ACH2GK_003241 [Proteus mirabilis]|nr:hypothetical protein GTH26_18430 [Proteus mirabilis]